jgi:hypothetical protein
VPGRMSFTENSQRYECGRSILIRFLMKQMKTDVNFWRKCRTAGNTCVAKSMISDQTGLIFTKTQMRSRSSS